MSELKPCPCGQVPKSIGYIHTKFEFVVYGDCCGLWQIDATNLPITKTVTRLDDCTAVAESIWNDMARNEPH